MKYVRSLGLIQLVAAVLLFGAGSRQASADYLYWTGNSSANYNDSANWNNVYGSPSGYVPNYYDDAWFTSQTSQMSLTYPVGTTPPRAWLFDGNGKNYTIGTPGDTNTIVVNQFIGGIDVRAGLTGHGGYETFNEPLLLYGGDQIGNFSPGTTNGITPSGLSTSSISGVGGYNNTLYLNGPISAGNGMNLYLVGIGNITINGAISDGSGSIQLLDANEGTLTLTGANTFTGPSYVGGNMVLDYRTDNTSKIAANNDLTLSWSQSGSGAQGSVTIIGNGSADTTQTVQNIHLNDGLSHVTVDGTNGYNATLSAQTVYEQARGAAGIVDYNTNATGHILITSGNNGSSQIMGQWSTYGEEYWATAVATATPGVNQVEALSTDNGDLFNNNQQDYTVDPGGQTLNGTTDAADTVRFASGGTLNLGGGNLNMMSGGILVTKDVTTSTAISNGSITSYYGGYTFINYGTGTLTVSANLDNNSIAKAGEGTVVLSGTNGGVNNNVVVDDGKLVMGSAGALGTTPYLSLATGTATLDLNGQNLTLSGLNSDNDALPGNQAAAAGYNSQIVNDAAGTLSRITVQGNSGVNSQGTYAPTADHTWGDPNVGRFTGGLNEASGAIISLDVEHGTAQSQVQLDFGTSDPWGGDVAGFNQASSSGLTGYATLFTGSVTVGAGANLSLLGYSNVQTLGATVLNGSIGWKTDQDSSYGTTYLTGTGNIVGNDGATFWLNLSGSATDTFSGYFGSAENLANTGLDYSAFTLAVGGTGSANFTNAVYGNGIDATGTAKLTLPGLTSGGGLAATGESSVTVTGNSGVVTGGNIQLYGGTIRIAPSGSGAASVSGSGNNFGFNDEATIILDNGGGANTLTYTFGQSGGTGIYGSNQESTLLIGSAQGLSALGNSDKFVILGSNNLGSTTGIVQQYHQGFFGVDFSPTGTQAATFLTYQGNGSASDQGFTPYVFAAGNTNSLATATNTSVQLVTDHEMLSADANVAELEVNGGSINTNGHAIYVNDYNAGTSSIILNGGASITGSVVTYQATHFYTDLDNGSISNVVANGQDVVKDGAGTLKIGGLSGEFAVEVNDGALDLGGGVAGVASNGYLVLHGGVLQGSGTYSAVLGNYGTGKVAFNVSNDYSNPLGGGFSARGGTLDVTLSDAVNGANLVWGSTSYFLAAGGVLDFGSTTSNNVVLFHDNLDLGPTGNGNSLYARVISVTGNSADAGLDPLDVADYTEMTGLITSNTNPYVGLEKDGTGVLYIGSSFYAGANTYTGATVVANGTLAIGADSDLGTGPTAAYAQNTTPGVSGDALTPGAVQINGGATLAAYDDVVLSSKRQILLASGTTGATPSNIDVADGSTMSFGGLIGDYIGEVGSLNVEGAGTFQYSGVSANTGTDSVSGGQFAVTGAGSVNSVSGIVLNNKTSTSGAVFNYSSSTALTRSVTFAAAANGSFGGGVFAYNTTAAYTGGALNVINQGTLSGSGNLGTTAVTIGSTGTIAPGQLDPTPGTLTQGATTFLTGGNYNFLVADVTGAAGTGYSTVDATSLDISSLGTFTINLESLAGTTPGNAANFNPAQSYSFVLVDTTGGITGTFDPAEFIVKTSANNGATGFSNPFTGTWSVSESGSNLLLDYTAAAVPEPSSYALLGLGLLGLGAFNRWRKRNA